MDSDNFESIYPPKPTLFRKKRTGHIAVTVFSMVLFVLTFSFILNDYYLIGLLLLTLVLHEGGHFLMMKLFKYEELNMLFIPFMGAMVMGKKIKYSQRESALMILAGPIPGIILGAAILLIPGLQDSAFWIQLGVMLVLLNVLNLIPIDPLDGGQLFRNLFFKNFELSQLIFAILSALSFMVIGLILNSWLFILFGFLLGLRIKSRHKMYLIRKVMRVEGINYNCNYEDLSNKAFGEIKNIVVSHNPVLEKIEELDGGDEYDQICAKQVDSVLVPPMDRDATWWFKSLMVFLWLFGIGVSIFLFFVVDLNTIVNAFQNRG